MQTEWNLKVFYQGTEDPSYEEDYKACRMACEQLKELTDSLNPAEALTLVQVEQLIRGEESIRRLMSKALTYLELRQAVNSSDTEAMAQSSRWVRLNSDYTDTVVRAEKLLGSVENAEEMAKESPVIAEHLFFLGELHRKAEHTLSEEMEAMVAAMDMTGASAWSTLQGYLTSGLKVDYAGEELTLSEIRNLAYDPDPAVRKAAYEAELAAYDKISGPVAFSLNHIKNQATMLAAKRGYESPLAESLSDSRMSRKTLDAMLDAIREYLPTLRSYFRKKAAKLGYEGGLPFYELFAPIGGEGRTYSLEECREYLKDCFGSFTPDMAEMMDRAFAEEWIDFYPHEGKSGGAFCADVPGQKQSRILTNYDGSFSSIDVLAHELGHAYHSRQLDHMSPLNQDYPMPVAETASTFNEVFLGHYALEQAAEGEKTALLESSLRVYTQCTVDIYCRYLFEKAVFEQAQEKFLMADDLKELMLDCQRQSYGDGLDPNFMHPFMWICKPHYYMSGTSFYNYPYAFGTLFALGLYAKFKKEGPAFVEDYKKMLTATATSTIEEDGALMGIDLTDKEFWRSSLQLIAEDIEAF